MGWIDAFADLSGLDAPAAAAVVEPILAAGAVEVWAAAPALPAPAGITRRLLDPLESSVAGDAAGLDGIIVSGTSPPPPQSLARFTHLPMFVTGSCPTPRRFLERACARHAGPVVFRHLASWPCAAEPLTEAVVLAGRDPRVYLETSGASVSAFIAHAASVAPEKVIFASGAPVFDPLAQRDHVAAALPDADLRTRVMCQNARALFGT